MLPGHEVCEERPGEILALPGREKGGMPIVWAILPFHRREIGNTAERRELGVARSLDSGVAHRGGPVLLRLARAHGDGDGHGRLDGKDIVALAWAATLSANVQNPNFVAEAAHLLAHPAEGFAIEVTGGADETDDARPARGLLLEDLPKRPAPEVDVKVVEVLDVAAVAGDDGGPEEFLEDGGFFARLVAAVAFEPVAPTIVTPPHPSAGAGSIIAVRRLVSVVGRIAQADDDGDISLDVQRLDMLLGDGLEEERQAGRFCIGAFERVSQVDVRAVLGQGCATVTQGAARAQLGHGVGADQEFKAVEMVRQRGRLAPYSPRALFGLYLA